MTPDQVWDYQVNYGLLLNLVVVLGLYSTVYFAFNGFEPTRKRLQKWRFSQDKYPDQLIVDLEVLRLVRSVVICSMIDAAVLHLREQYGWFPLLTGDEYGVSALLKELFEQPGILIATTVVLLLWADFHFYFTHRLLHTAWLFANIHSVHHQSKNPDAFSGLSFHWLEAGIYFSSLLGCAFIPMSLATFVAFRFGLLIAPIGHNSAGPLPHGQRFPQPFEDHYLHHIVVTKNFASGLFPYGGIWDNLLGTAFVPIDYRKSDPKAD